MDSDKSVTANFDATSQPNEYTLNISVVGNGRIEINPEKTVYTEGESVTLTAIADSGWGFDRWTGDASGTNNPITIVMDSDKSVTARFDTISQPDEYTLNTSVVGNGGIEISPEKTVYSDGESVTLTAIPDSGWQFDQWAGDASGSDNPVTLVMDSDKSVTAIFVTIPLSPYEPDDSSSEASWIQTGEIQEHSIDPVGDEDWVKFSLNANSAIVIETSGPAGDTVMGLYGRNLNLIEENDDNNGMFSRIDRTCGSDPLPADYYYVKVADYGNDDAIDQYFITYTATACSSTPAQQNDKLFLPLIRRQVVR
jgi:predicted component of type VI protein secretion system